MSRLAALVAFVFLPTATLAGDGGRVYDTTAERVVADDGTAYRMTRGVVRVPEPRTAGADASHTLELAFVRIRSDDADEQPPNFFLAGGPGDSGVALVENLARRGGARLMDLTGGDLVGIDQRGTGRSRPNLDLAVRYGLPTDRPGSPETWLPVMERVVREAASGLRGRDIDLGAYNTRESAADIDAVRRALGLERVVLWGRSYGSHLALAVLRDYPAGVARVVLANPEGPDHTWKLPARVDAVIERLAERLQRPDLPEVMRAVLARLEDAPVTVQLPVPDRQTSVKVVIGAFDVRWLTARALSDPRAMARLPAAFDRMHAGDFSGIARLALGMRKHFGPQSAMKHMMDLASGASPRRRASIAAQGETALLGNAINFPGMALAGAWGAEELDAAFRAPVTSDIPVLILAGDLDPRTPVENAEEIAATLTNAEVVTVENGSHRFNLFGTPELRAVLASFLAGEPVGPARVRLPPPGRP